MDNPSFHHQGWDTVHGTQSIYIHTSKISIIKRNTLRVLIAIWNGLQITNGSARCAHLDVCGTKLPRFRAQTRQWSIGHCDGLTINQTIYFSRSLHYGLHKSKLICGCYRAAETCLLHEICCRDNSGEDSPSPHASMQLLDRHRTYLSRAYQLGDHMMTVGYKAVIMAFTQRSGVCTSLLGAAV